MSDATGTVRGTVFSRTTFARPEERTTLVVEFPGVTPDSFGKAIPVAIVPLTPEAHARRVEAVAGVLLNEFVPHDSFVSDRWIREKAVLVLAALNLEPTP